MFVGIIMIGAFFVGIGAVAPSAGAAPRGFEVDLIARLDFPTQMAFDPSGRLLFVNERPGRVRLIRDGELLDQVFARVNTDDSGEGGLLGIAVDPRFDEGERWIYLFHSSADGATDQVTRIFADGARAGRRQVILDDIPAAAFHHGGVMTFGPDGKLYIANGDHGDRESAQDPQAFGGKVYRINPDGSLPDDNPIEGSRTYSYGHRNMFGIAFDAEGDLWISENGDDDHDELNRVERGGNHGWPRVEGTSGGDRYVDPVIDYEQIVVPTGIAFATGVLGARYQNDLFVGTYAQSTIRRIQLDGTRVRRDSVFHRREQIVGLLFGPDGLYYSTPTAVKRISNPAVEPSPTPSETPTERATSTDVPAGEQDDSGTGRALLIYALLLGAFVVGGLLIARDVRKARKQKAAR